MSAVATQAPRPRLWTRLFTLLTVANFGIALIFYLLTSTLSRWATDDLGQSPTLAGLVGTAWFGGAVMARLAAGPLLGIRGERQTLLGSLALSLACALLYPFVSSTGDAAIWLLLGLRLVHGLAFGVAATAVIGVALSRAPATRRGEASGWLGFGMAVTTGIGPYLGGRLQTSALGQQAVFAVAIAAATLSLVLTLLVAGRIDARPEQHQRQADAADIIERRALPVGFVVLLSAIPFGAVLTMVTSHASALGLGAAGAYYFLAYAAVVVVCRPLAGVLQDRLGDMVLLPPMVAATLLGLLLTALAPSSAVLLAGAALLGLGYGTLTPAGQTVAINRAGAQRAGLAVASFYLLVDGGTGVGPFVVGALVEPLGTRNAMLVGTSFALASLVAVIWLSVTDARRNGRAKQR